MNALKYSCSNSRNTCHTHQIALNTFGSPGVLRSVVGTFLCGPEALGKVLAKKCAKYSDVDPRKTKFYFNKENFWWPRHTRKPGHQETRGNYATVSVLENDKHPPPPPPAPGDYEKHLTVQEFKGSSAHTERKRSLFTTDYCSSWNCWPLACFCLFLFPSGGKKPSVHEVTSLS